MMFAPKKFVFQALKETLAMKKFEVVMIGNTAVGKTSMLATLSNELDSYNLAGKITIKPTSDEFRILQEQWNEMVDQVESEGPFTTLATGIEGNLVDFVEHEFDFNVDGKKEAHVVFTDTRGGMTGTLDDELVRRVNESFGVFCVVDASVLMECTEAVNLRFNCPKFIRELLQRVYTDGDGRQPRFVAFILTKCESYMDRAENRKELLNKFQSVFQDTLGLLQKMPSPPNLHVLAIQTMTCVRFFRLQESQISKEKVDGSKTAIKVKLPVFRVLPNNKLKTKDCAYPLVIMLQELIEATRSKGGGVLKTILNLLGLGQKDLTAYLDEVGRHVKVPLLYKKWAKGGQT